MRKYPIIRLVIHMENAQVQPDMEDLEGNMEDNEEAESAKEEEKLGKLHFTLDYDFQKSEVASISNRNQYS